MTDTKQLQQVTIFSNVQDRDIDRETEQLLGIMQQIAARHGYAFDRADASIEINQERVKVIDRGQEVEIDLAAHNMTALIGTVQTHKKETR